MLRGGLGKNRALYAPASEATSPRSRRPLFLPTGANFSQFRNEMAAGGRVGGFGITFHILPNLTGIESYGKTFRRAG